MNAFATGARRNSALVAVSTGLLRGMPKEEVEAVLAHALRRPGDGGLEGGRAALKTFDDRADYYPEAGRIHLKAVYEAGSERLLG